MRALAIWLVVGATLLLPAALVWRFWRGPRLGAAQAALAMLCLGAPPLFLVLEHRLGSHAAQWAVVVAGLVAPLLALWLALRLFAGGRDCPPALVPLPLLLPFLALWLIG